MSFHETYTSRNQAYVLAHDIVTNTGHIGVAVAESKSSVTGSGIVLSNDANHLTIIANITSLSNVYIQADVHTLLGFEQIGRVLLNDHTKNTITK